MSVHFCVASLNLMFCAAAFSAPSSDQPIRQVPDYVTAWPKQVPVLRPDPVLGDKLFTEDWVYGEDFAQRFKGFPAEKSDPELKNSWLKAIVLRIFKKNFWEGINSNYPKQYACEIDVYFNSGLAIPLSESSVPFKPRPEYPDGVSASYARLEAYSEQDAKALQESRPVNKYLRRNPLIFSVPLDGRFSAFGVRAYHQNLMSGMSALTLMSNYDCTISAPVKIDGGIWLSILGERPWSNSSGITSRAAHGWYNKIISSDFYPGASRESESLGYFKNPAAIENKFLNKSALIKVLNWCIHMKNSRNNATEKKISAKDWQKIVNRCTAAEANGELFADPQYHAEKSGIQDKGF